MAAAGRRALLAAGWYLHSNSKFAVLYEVEPFGGAEWTADEQELVLGGGVSKWGCSGVCPFPDKAESLDRKLWPLSCAVAERLWSPRSVNDSAAALGRLAVHRERLISRGVQAGKVV